jgi:serine protease Do
VSRSVCALALLASTGACRERVESDNPRPAVAPTETAPRIQYPSGPGSYIDLVASVRRGVVGIRAAAPVKSGPAAMFPGTPEATADVALGTGFLIEAQGVYVVTTDHIAASSPDLRVVLSDTTELPAKLVGRDVELDLALLSVDRPRLQALAMGDSNDLRVGQAIVVLGNAFGEEVTASAGIVSATGREAVGSLVQARGMGFRTFRMFIQTDARIHRGNSGGPMLDTAGQVIGVAVATADKLGELSFAIPINRVREVIDSLRDYGKVSRSWLGAKVKPVTEDFGQSVGLPKLAGAVVTEVLTGSPASRAQLRVGDVILKWGDRECDHRSLPWLVANTPVGKSTRVTIWRDRTQQQVAVIPDKMPE